MLIRLGDLVIRLLVCQISSYVRAGQSFSGKVPFQRLSSNVQLSFSGFDRVLVCYSCHVAGLSQRICCFASSLRLMVGCPAIQFFLYRFTACAPTVLGVRLVKDLVFLLFPD